MRPALSDPAKSTRLNSAARYSAGEDEDEEDAMDEEEDNEDDDNALLDDEEAGSFCSRKMVKIACERELCTFIRVLPTVREREPAERSLKKRAIGADAKINEKSRKNKKTYKKCSKTAKK